ncbi:MAG: M16 family metallopeptidase, partial [Bradymonadaceae bacterium]
MARPAPILRRAVLTAALLVGSAILATAIPRAAQSAEPEKLIHSKTLDNGLTVIAIPDPALPIVTTELAVRHGAFAESAEFDGLAHLYEHMFFKGNSLVPDQSAYLRRLEKLGIVFNGSTASERVNYFYTMPASNVDRGLELLRASTLSPKFDRQQFEKEKKIVLSEYDRAESRPTHSFRRTLKRKLWYEYPSRKLALGTRKTIADATIEQMRTIKDRYYVPNNCALLISGDIQPDRAFELAKKHFGDWKKAPNPFESHPIPEHPPLKQTKYVVSYDDVQVPRI